MGAAAGWLNYGLFNEAVAEELFSLDKAGRPVYLLPDQDAFEAVCKRAGAGAGAEGKAALLAAVRGTLVVDKEGVQPFQQHLGKSQLHAWNPIETPPSLALLVVLSMAADAMHAGEGMAANNYYGRLMTLLDVPEWRRGRVQSAYQHVAENVWGTVNDWLEAWEGERGTPTAYAVGQRYIGLPMSQALVRQHDRERLAEVFSAEGLPPGYQMALADMESVLDTWVNRQPAVFSHPLRILWGNAAARERIAAVACLELEAWRGHENAAAAGAAPSRYASVRLMAQVRTFPRASIELNLTLAAAHDSDVVTAVLARADGPLTMRLVKAGPGSLRFEDARHLDPASLLTDEVSLTVEASGAAMTRLPRRLVPLRFDDLQNCYVEVERVQLGEQTLVIAAENLRDNVEKVLTAVARPGWSVLDTAAAGVPPGWLVFRGVQVFDRFTGKDVHVDLQPLLPRSSATLVLSGGFSLPGRLRKWSSMDPPEVQVVTPQASHLAVRVDRGSKLGEALFEERVDGSVAVVPLTGRDLADGEYMVTLWVDEDKKPSATSLLRLRSGDTPVRELRDRRSGLVYRPTAGPLWPISACEPDGSPDVDGARTAVAAASGAPNAAMPSAAPRPRPPRAVSSGQLVRVGRPLGESSCMTTGLHRMLLPPVLPGRPVSTSIQGECTTCGLVKRYPGTAHGARKRTATGASRPLNLAALPPVADDDDRDHAVAFDALCHLGNGTAAEFARVAGQVEGSALFTDVLLRTLELLGHIDVRRHQVSQAPVEFEMTPPTLVELAAGAWWLVGRAPGGLTAALQDAAAGGGGTVEETLDQGVPRRIVRCAPDQLQLALSSSDRLSEIRVVAAAGAALAAALPPLNSIAAALPRAAVPSYDSLAKWEVKGASWVPTTTLASPGAYRLGGFSPLYGVRSAEDVSAGTIAFASPQLAKHVANLWAADPLAGYHAASASVVVPLGCDLPVLYGRALALCSGRAPTAHDQTRMLQYPAVSASVAAALHTSLTN